MAFMRDSPSPELQCFLSCSSLLWCRGDLPHHQQRTGEGGRGLGDKGDLGWAGRLRESLWSRASIERGRRRRRKQKPGGGLVPSLPARDVGDTGLGKNVE